MLVVLGILISYVDRGNLSIAAPSLMHDFALTPEAMGLLLSAFFWTYGACQLPAGWIVDRLGVRPSYFIAFFLWSLSSAATALSRNFHDILFLRLLLGMAESVGPLASLAFIRYAFDEEDRGFPVAMYIAGQTVGPALGTLVGTTIMAAAGWRTMFAVTGLVAMVWLPFWWFVAKLPPPASDRRSLQRGSHADWSGIAGSPSFWAMSACVFLLSYYWYFVLTWIPSYLTISRGLSILSMGRILSVPLFIMAPINLLVGWLADRSIRRGKRVLPVRIGIAATGLIGASSIVLLLHGTGRTSILFTLLISVCSFGAASASFWVLVQSLAPAHLTARTIGYFNTLSQLAGAVAPVITGYTLGPHKNFTVAIWLAAISAVGASLLLLSAGPRGVQRIADKFQLSN
jgi:MFS transporter, ACS family, D-galactonate transporter